MNWHRKQAWQSESGYGSFFGRRISQWRLLLTSFLPKLLSQSFNPSLLKDWQIAVGDRQNKTTDGRAVQMSLLAVNPPSVAPRPILGRIFRLAQLRRDQVVSKQRVVLSPRIAARLIKGLSHVV